MRTTAVADSGNAKLGPGWSVTYRPVGASCPSDCPLLGNGCYAQRGRVNMYAKRAGKRRTHYLVELRKLDGSARVRWDVSGDNLLADGSVDRDYLDAKYAFHRKWPDTIGLGYTHAARELQAAGYGPATHPKRFELLASTESRDEARELRADGWRTARVVDDDTAELDDCERLCPVDLQKHQGREVSTNCAKCGLCWASQHRNKSIVFIKF